MASTVQNYGTIARALVTHDGQTQTLKEWAITLGINYSVIRMRYKRGLRGGDLLFVRQ